MHFIIKTRLVFGYRQSFIWSDISEHSAFKVKISHLQLVKYKSNKIWEVKPIEWHHLQINWVNQDWLEQTNPSRFADLPW